MCILMACGSAFERFLCSRLPWKTVKQDNKKNEICGQLPLDKDSFRLNDLSEKDVSETSLTEEPIDVELAMDILKEVCKRNDEKILRQKGGFVNNLLLAKRYFVRRIANMTKRKGHIGDLSYESETTSDSIDINALYQEEAKPATEGRHSRKVCFDIVSPFDEEDDEFEIVSTDDYHAMLWKKLALAQRPLTECGAKLLCNLENLYGQMPALQVHEIQNDFKIRLEKLNAQAKV